MTYYMIIHDNTIKLKKETYRRVSFLVKILYILTYVTVAIVKKYSEHNKRRHDVMKRPTNSTMLSSLGVGRLYEEDKSCSIVIGAILMLAAEGLFLKVVTIQPWRICHASCR